MTDGEVNFSSDCKTMGIVWGCKNMYRLLLKIVDKNKLQKFKVPDTFDESVGKLIKNGGIPNPSDLKIPGFRIPAKINFILSGPKNLKTGVLFYQCQKRDKWHFRDKNTLSFQPSK